MQININKPFSDWYDSEPNEPTYQEAFEAGQKHEQAEILAAVSLLLRWCNDSMSSQQISQLEHETIAFCGAIK